VLRTLKVDHKETSFPGSPGLDAHGILSDGSAFTLLEVMIAVAVIAVALMALLGSQSQGLSLANESRFNTTASLLAQAKMAEIEARSDQGDLVSGSGDFGEDFPGYAWDISVQNVSFTGVYQIADRLKKIDLEVYAVPNTRYRYRLRLYRYFPK